MKHIDAEKLIAEIERRREKCADIAADERNEEVAEYYRGKEVAYDETSSLITSLQQEQPEEELEKEIDKFLNETGAPYVWCIDDEQKEWCNIIARHFWNKGYNARKKEEK